MSFEKPTFRHPKLAKNKAGFARRDYEGAISTLCAGCGHDSATSAIIQACFELGVEPHRVAKMSGIGCSSKTPAYFLSKSHGFNSVHGRMPSIATGAMHDGSKIQLHKVDSAEDVTNRLKTVNNLEVGKEKGRLLTGLLYVNQDIEETHDIINSTLRPLNTLTPVNGK